MGIEAEYNILEKIGTGGFSTVYRGSRITDEQTVAVKKIDKSKLKRPEKIDDEIQLLER